MVLRYLTAGESHGPSLIAILEGIPSNLAISNEKIDRELLRRQTGIGAGPRMKIEHDHAIVLSGVMEGVTNGAPIAIMIENKDHQKWRGQPTPPFVIPRPGHADLAGLIKYQTNDIRPVLERASARETAARVAVGAICKQLLDLFQIKVGGYVISIGQIDADYQKFSYQERIHFAEENEVRCPDPLIAPVMAERIRKVMQERDTLGGIIEIACLGVPPGLGSYVHCDRRLDTRLGAAVLSVQAIKGVEFGAAFDNAKLLGTQVHDPIRLSKESDDIIRESNNSGGLEGGISTGQPIIIRAAMKPIATTLKPQPTVDLSSGEEVTTQYERSDFCPVPRAVPILEAVVAFIIADSLLEKLGGDSIDEILNRYKLLRKLNISDLHLDRKEHFFW